MRYVILGAGAIGGAIGGKLAVHGRDVVLVARGAHLEALQREGLELRDPDSTERIDIRAVGSTAEAGLTDEDCVIVATKAQHTEVALDELRAAAGSHARAMAVVCAQNGVENERVALRRFEHVYGMRVILAGTHLEPGVVEIATAPVFGVLDVGRFPAGRDATSEAIAADLVASGFDATSSDQVMSFKYLKLLVNLGNALEAASGTRLGSDTARAIFQSAQAEARACFEAAGIEVADEAHESARRKLRGGPRPVNGVTRRGGSSWQSLERGTGNIEADYLNGEIVLLGRMHGIPTPVNALLQELANRLARERRPAGSVPVEEIAASLGDLASLGGTLG
ncbi:MAG: ketopantoate reductase family protein [Acidimicrobiales bacterium]|jgi:2-dehydropantoate 2-reductase